MCCHLIHYIPPGQRAPYIIHNITIKPKTQFYILLYQFKTVHTYQVYCIMGTATCNIAD